MSEKINPIISIVSPVYNAEQVLVELVQRIETTVQQFTNHYEIILVEDRGPDQSWNIIKDIAAKNTKVKGLKLSRNFGQHYAITAGLDHSQGEWIVVMDCDLQDVPEEIKNLYIKAQEGYDVVLARRKVRKDSFSKRLFSNLFYRFLGYLTGSKHDKGVANFGIYHQKVIRSVNAMRESIRFFPTMVRWVGYRQTIIDVNHAARTEGETNYNFKRLLRLALDIILAYSDKPIRLTIKFGFLMAIGALIMALITFLRWLSGDIEVLGYTSLIISIWLLSGILLSTLGVIGLYVGKTFEGVKNRPIYFVDESVNEYA